MPVHKTARVVDHEPRTDVATYGLRTDADRLSAGHEYGRYGYRRITTRYTRRAGGCSQCVERIWRQEGLKVPQKQPNEPALVSRWLLY